MNPGETYVFFDERVQKVLLTQIDRIGKVGVEVLDSVPEGISVQQKFQEINGTLASLRLDAAVAFCCGISREKAAALISAGIGPGESSGNVQCQCPAERWSDLIRPRKGKIPFGDRRYIDP